MKYVLVTGGVVSGLGKGVTASSIGVLLKACGFRVTAIKIGEDVPNAAAAGMWRMAQQPACRRCQNVCLRACGCSQTRTSTWMRAPCRRLSTEKCLCWMTAARCVAAQFAVGGGCAVCHHHESWHSTMRPQADLDLGNYERFMDLTLMRDNNLTTGKVYSVRQCAACGLATLRIGSTVQQYRRRNVDPCPGHMGQRMQEWPCMALDAPNHHNPACRRSLSGSARATTLARLCRWVVQLRQWDWVSLNEQGC